MLSNFKAFLKGWSAKGEFPGVDPSIVRPYTDFVEACVGADFNRVGLRMVICDHMENTRAFDFAFEVLPFSVALTVARMRYSKHQDKIRFIQKTLSHVIDVYAKSRSPIAPALISLDIQELNELHHVYRLSGGTESLKEFITNERSYAEMLDVAFASRALAMVKIYLQASEKRNGKEILTAFALKCAEQFMASSTEYPAANKKAIIAQYILKLYFDLLDKTK